MTRLESLMARASGQTVELPSAPAIDYDAPVPGEGPMDAKIIVLGESLGREEWEHRRNFIGKSGQKLRNHMRLAGILPDKCRIENTYPFYPPGGSIDHLDADILRQWQKDALGRLEACRDAEVVVCVGNIALETLTGHRDISRRRGSVYEWQGKKVIGMIHPAAILHSGGLYEKHCRLDWERVKLLTTPHETHHTYCGCAVRQARRHITPYTVSKEELKHTIQNYLKVCQNPQKVLAIDIETPKMLGIGKRYIECVGFALTPNASLVLPFDGYEKEIITLLCASPCIKLGHNIVTFDRWWLEREGVKVNGEVRDSLCAHHCLDPASVHSLEFLTSRYTWEPWYKDEAQGHDIALIDNNKKGYYSYCGLDSCMALELHNIFWPELKRRGMLTFYRHHYEALYDPILNVMMRGVHIDHEARKATLESLLMEARQARDRLASYNGAPLFTLGTKRDQAVYAALCTPGDDVIHILETQYGREAVEVSLKRIEDKVVSNAQLKRLLYEKLELPVQTKRRKGGEETPTAEGVALRKLRVEFAHRQDVVDVIDLSLKHNKAQKLASFLYPTTFDDDGMFRFTLKLNTEAGRLASSKAPNGLGRNAQNLPRDKRLRRIELPDPDHVWVGADASQIEGRIVFVRTKDKDLIQLGRARTDFDQHAYTASLVFGKPVELVGKGTNERQVAKSISHAAQRAMQGKTMADWMLKNNMLHEEGTLYDPDECDALLGLYYKAFPGIPLWQQRIRRELRATKRLVNRYGRIWDVRYAEMNDELYRKGYNFFPQSECAELINSCFVALYYWLRGEYAAFFEGWNMGGAYMYPLEFLGRWRHTDKMQSRILQQEHDELDCSCPPSEAYDVAHFLKDHMEVELEYDGIGLSVPGEYKLGKNWGDCAEMVELPSREEFERKVQELIAA